MSIRVVKAEASLKTGRILEGLLRDSGTRLVASGEDAVVSYGVRCGNGKPTLNARAGMADKYEQLVAMESKGILIPPIYKGGSNPHFPLLARKRQHRAGKDIMPVFQFEEIEWRVRAGAQFFVDYIPRDSEFRIWIFRQSHLGTYQKHMDRPSEYKHIGWNYHNGFVFRLVSSDSVPRGAVESAQASINALGLDFGAVDILRGKDGRFYSLEVNTAPGVEGPGRQAIQSLAQHIRKWEGAGYPSRKG